MNKLRIIYALLLLLPAVVWAFIPSTSVSAQTTPVTLRLAPAYSQIDAGETIDVNLEVVNTPAIYGFEFNLTFNPTYVEVVDRNPSLAGVQIVLGPFFDPGFEIQHIVNNTTGEIKFAMTQLNPSVAKSGTGVLATIRFRGKASSAGPRPLTMTKADIATRDGFLLATAPQNGAIVVGSNLGPRILLPLMWR